MWRHKPGVKDDGKRKHKWKPGDISSIMYKIQRNDLIMKTLI